MNNKAPHQECGVPCPIAAPRLSVSKDGYIRLTSAELQCVRLTHLISGLDDSSSNIGCAADGACAAITGYTEWLSESETSPRITIGWDWEMHFANNRVELRRIGEPRSNLMLLDETREDLAYQRSVLLQEMFIDGLAWQPTVHEHINSRYR